jgi:hypothetical protein
MSNNLPRYDGKPLLRLLELWVQWVIDEIDPQDVSRLTAMEPSLRNTWKLSGTWHDMIERLLELEPTVRDELRAIWRRNLETAKQHGVAPPVEMFSQSIADQMIGSN